MDNNRITHHDAEWAGYTLDELRYQRAVTLARIEIEKEKLKIGAQEMRSGVPGAGGMMGKVLSSLNYIDYIVLAFKMTRAVSKAFGGLRRR